MCCVLTTLMFLGPRSGILVWWLLDQERWNAAFSSFFWAFLGFLFLPWTTLIFVGVSAYGGITGFDWIWLGLGLLADLGMYSGGGYGNRNKLNRA